MKFSILSFLFLITVSISSHAQVVRPGSAYDMYTHLIYLSNSESDYINSQIVHEIDTLNDNIWGSYFDVSSNAPFQLYDPELNLNYNVNRPFGYNDGPVWKGKGVTTELNAGFYGSKGSFSYFFVPSIFYSQNADFSIAPTIRANKSPFNYQFTTGGDIDYVQRYGEKAFIAFYPGQSEIRFSRKHITLAASTQNITFGPSTVNPILLSQQGSGIPHFNIGTPGFLELKWKETSLGKLSTDLYWGILKESAYFDEDTSNDDRYFTAISFTYKIPKIKHLKIGFNRVFYQDATFFEIDDLTRTIFYFDDENIQLGTSGNVLNDRFDQMVSVFAEWIIPEVGLRTYFEFAKNDFNGTIRNFLVDPDHSRAFTLGFDKSFDTKDGKMLLTFEHTNLSRSISYQYRPEPPFYIHSQSKQGYTQDGQLLGAGIGPGSSSNHISLGHFTESGLIKIAIQRVQFNDDYFSQNLAVSLPPNYENKDRRNSEYTLQAHFTKFSGNWGLSFDLGASRIFNEYFVLNNDTYNVFLGFSVKYFIK